MDKFIKKRIYKQRDPIETINLIKSIINKLDIDLKETSFYHESSLTYASELRFNYEELNKTRIATNGKGMNEEYSLASAYGEMMERIECNALLIDYQRKAFINKEINCLYSYDEKFIDAIEFVDVISKLLNCSKDFLSKYFKDYKTLSVPFYDVINDKEIYLPIDIMFKLISSNGMCAGNTPKEAMAQGLNEIYERQALMEIYRDNPILNKLDKELFNGTSVYDKLKHLELLGYDIDVIDCSMSKGYPVIGLRIRNDNGLSFNLGADPNPIVALERCLTEQYQTITEDSLKHRFSKDSCGTNNRNIFEDSYYHLQLIRSKTYGSGEKPDNVHNIEDIYSNKYKYNSEDIDDFDYLLSLTKELGYSLYIRDCSYLGFPAYITFIPELSLADYFDEHELKSILEKLLDYDCYKEKDGYETILPIVKKINNLKNISLIKQNKSMFNKQ